MSVTVQPPPTAAIHAPAVPDVPIYRLSAEQYEAMIAAGILTEDDPVELLEGWLVQKMTKNPPHIVATALLVQILPRILPPGWYLSVQDPVSTPDSRPEPDAAIVRGAPRDYLQRRPAAADIALAIEVADTSLDQDRGLKKRHYARSGIEVYWIVNLVEGQIEVYTDPSGPADEPTYLRRQDYGPSDTIPLVLSGDEVGRIAARELLP